MLKVLERSLMSFLRTFLRSLLSFLREKNAVVSRMSWQMKKHA